MGFYEILQAFESANIGSDTFKDYTINLLSLATSRKDLLTLSNSNYAKNIIHGLYRRNEVEFDLVQTYRDLNYTVTTHAYAAISDKGTIMMFTYDNMYEYTTLDDFVDILRLAHTD